MSKLEKAEKDVLAAQAKVDELRAQLKSATAVLMDKMAARDAAEFEATPRGYAAGVIREAQHTANIRAALNTAE